MRATCRPRARHGLPERGRPGDRRGRSHPRQLLPGTREAWPQRVSWLSRRSGQTRPPTVGTLGRQNRHTRILRSPVWAVSTTGNQPISQEFQPGPRGGSGSANGRQICSRRARGEPQSRPVRVRSVWGSSSADGTPWTLAEPKHEGVGNGTGSPRVVQGSSAGSRTRWSTADRDSPRDGDLPRQGVRWHDICRILAGIRFRETSTAMRE